MLKVMTLNINIYGSKHGLWDNRQEIIHEIIVEARPEIIAFQAVRQDSTVAGGVDQAGQLAQRLQPAYPHVLFQPAMKHPDGSMDGLALLSTVPIAETQTLPLTLQAGLDDTNRRVLLRARFDLPDGPFYLFNAHFSWVPSQNAANVAEALPYITGCPGPAMLVGDLNAAPDTVGMERFREAGWTDAWAALHGEAGGYTFESNQPTLRIDYAWLNSELTSRLQDIELVANRPDSSGARASDHFGLLITLDIGTLR